jgi:hypothetical protein
MPGNRRAANALREQGSISQRGAREDCWRCSVTVVRSWLASSQQSLFFLEHDSKHTATLHSVT